MGTLQVWDTFFQIEIGNFSWHGKLLEGQYSNWRGVIPSANALNYSITPDDPAAVIDWVKNIPSQKTTNGVELNVMPDGSGKTFRATTSIMRSKMALYVCSIPAAPAIPGRSIC